MAKANRNRNMQQGRVKIRSRRICPDKGDNAARQQNNAARAFNFRKA
jgi:hypothetical protein